MNSYLKANFEPEMIYIPEGSFFMGSTQEEVDKLIKQYPETDKRLFERELPQHMVHLPSYLIGKKPVTNREFSVFIKKTGYKTTAEIEGWGFHWQQNRILKIDGISWFHPESVERNLNNREDHPVVLVSWFDALAYCQWLAETTKKPYRLLSEAEWEKAARGNNSRKWPWGNQWNCNLCNCNNRVGTTTVVGAYSPKGDSPYGCQDMIGNVWEWTNTTIGTGEPWPAKYTYPYIFDDGRESADLQTRRVGRGGSWTNDQRNARSAFRFADPPSERYTNEGFRIAMDLA